MVEVRMFVDEGLGHSSHLVDLGDGTTAFIDPPRLPTEHLAVAEVQGTAPGSKIDTRSHADDVTGSPSLAARSGATFNAPAASKLETPHGAVDDDELIGRRRGWRGGRPRPRGIYPTTTPLSSSATGRR